MRNRQLRGCPEGAWVAVDGAIHGNLGCGSKVSVQRLHSGGKMFQSVTVNLNAYHCLAQGMALVAVGDVEVCDKQLTIE